MRKWIPFWTIPVLMVFSIGTVWLRLAIVGMTYDINKIEQEMKKNRQDRELLQIKMAALKSPKRLEVLARNKFGLTQPQMGQIVHFKNAP